MDLTGVLDAIRNLHARACKVEAAGRRSGRWLNADPMVMPAVHDGALRCIPFELRVRDLTGGVRACSKHLHMPQTAQEPKRTAILTPISRPHAQGADTARTGA